MDDALAQRCRCHFGTFERVLILVVMDDALALTKFARRNKLNKSLNPCCNG